MNLEKSRLMKKGLAILGVALLCYIAFRISNVRQEDVQLISKLFNSGKSHLFMPDKVVCNFMYPLGICPCTRNFRVLVPRKFCSGADPSWKAILLWIKKEYGESTCGEMATLRGPHQRVVSYTTYGPFPSGYYKGMEVIAPSVPVVYPGWTVRWHHVLNISNENISQWLCKLVCGYPHLDVCDATKLPTVGNVSGYLGMGWRFAPMGDPLVDWYMSRDSDSPIIQREVDAVKAWLQSKKCFHMMRDHPYHGVPILGGMWGGCGTWKGPHNFGEIRDKIIRNAFKKGHDQRELARHLWPVARNNATMHDSYTCRSFKGSLPFPTQRGQHNTYVAVKSLLSNAVPSVPKECPVACRPKDHQDWKYC